MKKILLLLTAMFMALSVSAVNSAMQVSLNGVTSNKIIVVGCTAAAGRVYTSGTGVTDRGFCWSTSPNPTVNDNKTNTYWGDDDWDSTTPNGSTTISSSAGTIYVMRTLQPSTRYYIRPYIKKNGTYYYGQEQRVWTQPQGDTQVTWNRNDADDGQNETGIQICQEAEDWFNEWCSFRGYTPWINYDKNEDGAHGSYGGWITMGAAFTWNTGTIMHEMGHGIGVGQDWYYTSWDSPLHNTYLWNGERAGRVFTLFEDKEDGPRTEDGYSISDGDRVHVCFGLTGNINPIRRLRQAAYYEGMFQDGLPCVSNDYSRGAGPYFSFDTEAYLNGTTETNLNTKYYITNELVAPCNRFLMEENGELKYKEISRSALSSNNAYGWYIIYNPSNGMYYIKNASTGHYFTYEYATGFGLTTSTTVNTSRWQERMHLMPSRNNTTINGKKLKAYWIHPGNRDRDPDALTASMINQGIAATAARNFYDDGYIQRWMMLTQDELNNVGDVQNTTANPGVTEITQLPSASDYSKYFFLLTDHTRDLTLMLWNSDGGKNGDGNDGLGNHIQSPRYCAKAEVGNIKALWTLTPQNNGGSQVFTNADYPHVQLQTESNASWYFRTNNNNLASSRAILAYLSDGYWTLQNPNGGNNYLGPWEDGNFGDWQEVAFNKSGDSKVGHLNVYQILRGEHVKYYRDYSSATPGNPLDITYVLENPGGERQNNAIGWQTVGTAWNAADNNSLTGKVGNCFMERWDGNPVGNAELYQKVYGLPDGYYRFSAIATRRADETGSFYLYANGEQSLVGSANDGNRTTVVVQVTNGELQIGAKGENLTGDWIAFDDAKLEYIGTNVATYNVGNPVTTLEEGNYFESLTTFDFDFIDAVTVDNSVAFAILNSSAKVTLKKNGTTVKEGTISLKGTKLTADFGSFTPDLNSTYTITLPAGTVGYAGHVSNAAITITIHTPVFKAGYYYLRNNDTGAYLSRGRGLEYNTEGMMDNFGIPVYLGTDDEGSVAIRFADSRQWLYGGGYTYTDQGSYDYALKFTVEDQGNGVYIFRNRAILNGSDQNCLSVWDGNVICDAIVGSHNQGNQHLWTLESIADHRANYTRNADAQAAALGITGVSTWTQLESQMTNNYSGTQVYTDIADIQDHWQWGAATHYYHQLTDLPNGIYRITVNGFQRATQWDWMWDVDNTNGMRGVCYLYGNNQKTQFIANTEDGGTYSNTSGMHQHNGLYYPDNTASAERAFNAGKFKNTLYVKVTNGTLDIGIEDPSYIFQNNQWIIYKSLKVERMVSGLMELQANIANGASVGADIGSITLSPTGTATSATLANGTKVTLYKDDTQLSQITPTVSGANLVVALPTLEEGHTYKLTLDEKKITFNTGVQNAAYELSFTVPAFEDGLYYVKNNSEGQFLSRGGYWAKQAVLEDWGVAFYLTSDAQGITLQAFDSKRYLFDDGDYVYTDKVQDGAIHLNIKAVTGGFTLQNVANNQYLVADGKNVKATATTATAETIWTLIPAADYLTAYATAIDQQAATAATGAEFSGVTTLAGLESYLATNNYNATSINVAGANVQQGRYEWNGQGDWSGAIASEYYKETVTGLIPGLYRLTVDAFQRACYYDDVRNAEGARGCIYLYANNAKTQIKSVMEYAANEAYSSDYEANGLHYPNNDDAAYNALSTGNYSNVVYVYVPADDGQTTGSIVFGINNESSIGDNNGGTWAVFQNFRLERMTEGQSMILQADIANGSFVENLTSITISPTGEATSATLASGTKLTLYKDGVAVSQIYPTVSGANLIVNLPTLEKNHTYKLTLDANKVTFDNGSKNLAFEVTFTVPYLADGTYYLYNVSEGKYLSRGMAYGTQAIVDDWGLAIKVENKDGKTLLKYFDGNQYLYWADWYGSCFADGNEEGAVKFTINMVGDNFQFLNGEQYLAVVDGHAVANAAASSTTNVWRIESTADHVANYTRLADAQAAAAATAASITGVTTFAAMETMMNPSYARTSISITGGTNSRYEWYASSGDDPTVESEYFKETVTGLEPGLYRLTVDAFQRAAWYDDVFGADKARGSIYLYANDAKTQLKSVMEYAANEAYTSDYEANGLHYPNNDEAAYNALGTGNYRNVVYVYVPADNGQTTGSLTFGINNPNRLGQYDQWRGTWAVFQNFQLEKYTERAAGDVNNDGVVDMKDARAIARILTGHHADESNKAYNEEAADQDGDGFVTLRDLTMFVNQHY